MAKPRITILNQYFYPENITAATLPYELAKGLVKSGYNVRAVVGAPKEYFAGKANKNESISGISVERMNYTYRDRSKVFGRLVNYFSFFFAIFKNRKKLKNTDILITYSSPPINPIVPAFFAKRYGFKIIYVVYDLYPDMACRFGYLKPNGVAARAFTLANNYVFQRCEKIVVLSDEMKDYFIAHKGYADKVVCIPNWYKNEPVKPAKGTHEKIKILYGGNVGIVQDVDTLTKTIISVKDNKNIDFIFAAHGSRLEPLLNTLKENSVSNARLIGFMPKEKYDAYLGDIDLAIISLDKRMHGLASPSKFYSYIAKALPVLFIGPSDMDVAKEITQHRIGYVIANGEINKIRSILTKLSHDKSTLPKMGLRARKLFEDKYTLEHCLKKYEILITEITEEKQRV